MSDMISYQVSFDPSPTPITVSVTVVADALTATVTSVPDIGISLSPSGNFAQKIISAVLEPIALIIKDSFKNKPHDMLQGQTMPLGKIRPYTVENITVSASTLALGSSTLAGTQYLKATAKLSVAVATTSGSTA